ncbi:MAG: hypothetical protein Q9160_008289 [Pyrenula sp. 1 TL-2023]
MAMSEVYMLPRDASESHRLDWQHLFMKGVFHNQLLHCSIPILNTRAVADVATGTGVWLRDLASSWPALGGTDDTEFWGFDISSSQFPQINAANIHLRVHDTTQPFSEEFKDRFDVVNVRLMTYAIKVNDMRKIIQNIAYILKPGGIIQWQEADAAEAWANPGSEMSRDFVSAIVAERKARDLFPTIASPLVKAISAYTVPIPPGTVNPLTWTDQMLRIMQLQSISTENHPHPFVRKNATKLFVQTGVSLLRSGVERTKALACESGVSSQRVADLLATADKMSRIVDSVESNPEPDAWNADITWIVARKAAVISGNEQWMAFRSGALGQQQAS